MPRAPKLRSYLIILFVAALSRRGQRLDKAHSRHAERIGPSRAKETGPIWIPRPRPLLKNRLGPASAFRADELRRPVTHRQISYQ